MNRYREHILVVIIVGTTACARDRNWRSRFHIKSILAFTTLPLSPFTSLQERALLPSLFYPCETLWSPRLFSRTPLGWRDNTAPVH